MAMKSAEEAIDRVLATAIFPVVKRDQAGARGDDRDDTGDEAVHVGAEAEVNQSTGDEEPDAGYDVFDNLVHEHLVGGGVAVNDVDVEHVCGEYAKSDISSLNATLVTRRRERQRTGRSARWRSSTAANAFFAAAAAIVKPVAMALNRVRVSCTADGQSPIPRSSNSCRGVCPFESCVEAVVRDKAGENYSGRGSAPAIGYKANPGT